MTNSTSKIKGPKEETLQYLKFVARLYTSVSNEQKNGTEEKYGNQKFGIGIC